MVSQSSRRERAQVLLTGAIAVAFVIIGLVVVVNTLIVTEDGLAGDRLDRADQAESFEFEARRNVQRLLLEVNHRERNVTAPAVNASIHENVSRYGRLLGETYGASGSTYVDLAYHNASSTWGERIVQVGDDRYQSPGGGSDWWLIRNVSGQRREVGRFVVNANMRSRWLSTVNVSATNATGSSLQLELGKERDGSVRVDWTASDRPDGTTTCDTRGGRSLLGLVSGRAHTADCDFPGLENVGGPVAVRIENGQGGVGKFGLVANDTVDTYDDGTVDPYPTCDDGVDADRPCTAPVVWEANVTVTFDTTGVTIDRTQNVSVYP
ncbi:hypothetical protein [Halorientalis halophila]|uniref:hypothetical protein n=1 Tax=Halorientalis halophila TaxID=3108499 RepID=UPI00300B6833